MREALAPNNVAGLGEDLWVSEAAKREQGAEREEAAASVSAAMAAIGSEGGCKETKTMGGRSAMEAELLHAKAPEDGQLGLASLPVATYHVTLCWISFLPPD